MARCRMHHQPCGLVQYQDVFILEDDIQRNVLRHPLALRLLLGRQLEDRPCVHRIARTQHRTVDREQAILYPGAEARAGVVGEQLRRDLVETLPAQLERHLGAELDRLCIDCRHIRDVLPWKAKRSAPSFGTGGRHLPERAPRLRAASCETPAAGLCHADRLPIRFAVRSR